jgi:hypothetical protein
VERRRRTAAVPHRVGRRQPQPLAHHRPATRYAGRLPAARTAPGAAHQPRQHQRPGHEHDPGHRGHRRSATRRRRPPGPRRGDGRRHVHRPRPHRANHDPDQPAGRRRHRPAHLAWRHCRTQHHPHQLLRTGTGPAAAGGRSRLPPTARRQPVAVAAQRRNRLRRRRPGRDRRGLRPSATHPRTVHRDRRRDVLVVSSPLHADDGTPP